MANEWLDIANITPRIAYTATAGQTAFAVPFVFFNEPSLKVYKNTVLLTLATHYTVSAAEQPTGTITLLTGATVGDEIMIVRHVAIEQTTHIPPSGPLDISAINIQISKLIAIDQQQQDEIDRSFHFPDGDSTASAELASAATRSNRLLGFDSNGAIIYPLGPTFVGDTSTGVAHVDSRATAQVTTFAASVNVVITGGYAAPGDGGGRSYVRGLAGGFGVFQDAGGVYWVLAQIDSDAIPVYDTATALAASTAVDSTQTIIKTRGKLAVGDFGGATYLQVASDPSEQGAFQLASGRWVKLLEPVVTPQMFKLTADASDAGLMLNRFFTYVVATGGRGLIPRGSYAITTQVSITQPTDRRVRVDAGGAVFTTTGAISAFYVTGGGYSGGIDFVDFTILHQGNASATFGWDLRQCGGAHLISPIVTCGLTGASYCAIYVTQSNTADINTGSYWNLIQDPQIFSNTADLIPCGIELQGAANATRIIGGQIASFLRAIRLDPMAASGNYSPNGVLIDGVSFEVGTYGIYFVGVLGDADTRPLGLRIVNNRFEQVGTLLTYVNVDQASEGPTHLSGNMLLGVTNYISNPNGVRIDAFDYPNDLAGTVAFTGNTARDIVFGLAQSSANFVVTIDAPVNQPFWVTLKGTTGFRINTTPALTATVGWTVTRLA